MSDQLWIAEFETTNTRSRGFGSTPEEAMFSLVDVWRDKWCPASGASPDYIAEYREDITVQPFELGRGYLIGTTDEYWHAGINGSDPRFDEALLRSPSPGKR